MPEKLTLDPLAAMSVDVPAPLNLVPNPSFEAGVSGWAAFDNLVTGVTFAAQTGWASRGLQSVRRTATFTTQAGAYAGIISNAGTGGIPILTGQFYSARCEYNLLSVPTLQQGMILGLFWYDSGGTLLGTSTFSAASPSPLGPGSITVVGQAPTTAAFASLFLYNPSNGAGTLDFYADAFLLVRGQPEVELIDRPNGLDVIDEDWAAPEMTVLSAASIDTEGGDSVASQYEDRTVAVKVRCFDTSPIPAPIVDAFTTNSLPSYSFDTGSGTLSISGEQLVPSSTAEKRLTRSAEGLLFENGDVTLKFTTGASVATGETDVLGCWLGPSDYLMAQASNSGIAVYKNDGGTLTQLVITTGTLSTATSYWVRLRIDGNDITGELWAAPPTPTGFPLLRAPVRLTGADAVKYGAGAIGRGGMRLIPAGTDYRYDDFSITPRSQMLAAIARLQQKVGKLQREGGVVARTLTNGQTVFFEVRRNVKLTVPADYLFFRSAPPPSATCDLTLVCAPLGWGPETAFGDNPETVLPVLVFTKQPIRGDVPALGRLVVDNDQTNDRLYFRWGMRSRTYDPGTSPSASSTTTTAALYYEAETRLPLGGAALAARSGASGGTIVRQGTLTGGWQAMLSLASAGTAYCSHVGDYGVMARIYDPVGTAQVALEWSQGDLVNVTRNDPVSAPTAGDLSLVDLGQVHLGRALTGTQRWDGKIIAKGPVGGTIDVDYVMFFPLEASGQATASPLVSTSSALLAHDEFVGTTAGAALNGRTAPLGGAWATSGQAGDFLFADSGVPFGPYGEQEMLLRSVNTDTGVFGGRIAVLGSATIGTDASCWTYMDGVDNSAHLGMVARYVDASNLVRAYLNLTTQYLVVSVMVAGSQVYLLSKPMYVSYGYFYGLRVVVQANGQITAYATDVGGNVLASVSGIHTSLATGGALATGKAGLWDYSAATTGHRYFDFALAPLGLTDAVIYGSRSLEIRSDRVRRQDSTGVAWADLGGRYEGDYLRLPPSGQEGRSVEFIVKVSNGDPATSGDLPPSTGLSARLFVTPRYLQIPEN